MAPRPSIYLRRLIPSDRFAFLKSVQTSSALHGPWVSAPSTLEEFDAYMTQMQEPANHGFLLCMRDGDRLVGVFNLTNVVLGAFRSGYLGYYAFAGHERQGLMSQGLRAVSKHAFGALKLHRIEANIQPANLASIALVRSCGFLQEGYSPRYLKIGGRWRDHERWALVAS